MEVLFAAISLGFLGSFHCIGMCGPIALALPVHNKPLLEKNLLILVYNVGRILTYSILGVLAGLVGKSFVIAGFQQSLSILIGMLLLLFIFLPKRFNLGGLHFFVWLKATLSKLFSIRSNSSLFFIGLLNGLLPCGLVYVALAGAVATGDWVQGAWFMAGFGVGTMPMMFVLPLASGLASPSFRSGINRFMPAVVTTMALVLILRGLNLGIPYLSPKISSQTEVTCHEPPLSKPVIFCEKPHSK
jgi:sulfite exporter TauE/SafE